MLRINIRLNIRKKYQILGAGCSSCFCFCFLGLHLRHTEVLRQGVESELHVQVYTTAIATRNPSPVCNLHHSSQQHQILSPLSEIRNQTRVLMDSSWIHYHWATMGTPSAGSFKVALSFNASAAQLGAELWRAESPRVSLWSHPGTQTWPVKGSDNPFDCPVIIRWLLAFFTFFPGLLLSLRETLNLVFLEPMFLHIPYAHIKSSETKKVWIWVPSCGGQKAQGWASGPILGPRPKIKVRQV